MKELFKAPIKLIIAGSRTITDYSILENFIKEIELNPVSVSEVVSGTAKGVDSLGELWAFKNRIPIKRFPAEWGKYGKSAGYKRNLQMSLYGDVAIIIMTADSKGSTIMKNLMEKADKPCYAKVI